MVTTALQFRIANTFDDSLARLPKQEQTRVKVTVYDLQRNPAQPGHQMHKLEMARDSRFWSVRVSRDIRIIVHRTAENFLLCYVNHHDEAYRWASRRKIEVHPTTGAAQMVELWDAEGSVTNEDFEPVSEQAPSKSALLGNRSDEALLDFGVPPDWLDAVRAADEDSLLELVEHLPGEAMEALLQLATGGIVQVPEPAPSGTDPFDHPDAQRRFRVVSDVE